MARTESDRDDLMAEAVAMIRRVEMTIPNEPTPIVTGFRANGWLSIYLGPDRMYQFDEVGRLRRAFVNGLLFRTQGTTLAQLDRQRTDTETILSRRDLSLVELAAFRMTMLEHISALHDWMTRQKVVIVRQIPADDDQLLSDLAAGFVRVQSASEFLAPSISGKS